MKKKEVEKEAKILKEIKGTTGKSKGKVRRTIEKAKEKERQRDEKEMRERETRCDGKGGGIESAKGR